MSRPETDLDLGDEDSVGGVTSMVTSNLVPADQLLKKKQVVFSGRQLIKDGTIFGTGGTGVLLVLVGIAVFYKITVKGCIIAGTDGTGGRLFLVGIVVGFYKVTVKGCILGHMVTTH